MYRVGITGIGLVTSLGAGGERFWRSLVNGVSGITRITRFCPGRYRTKIAGTVDDSIIDTYFENNSDGKRLDRVSKFAMIAFQEALEDASLDLNRIDRNRIGIILGTASGGSGMIDEQYKQFYEKKIHRLSPYTIPTIMYNAPSCHLALKHKISGFNLTVSNACTSSTDAIGMGYRLIKSGFLDVAIVGGTDSQIAPGFFSAWCSLRVMSEENGDPTKAMKPFSKNRNGFILGEGAGIVILENIKIAEARDAHIYGEIVGFANNAMGIQLVSPSRDGEVKVMQNALSEAGISYKAIDYINAHGTATPLNDKIESEAIKEVFKERTEAIPVNSTKPFSGHCIGASGVIECIVCILSIKHTLIHRNLNYEYSEDTCDLYFPTDNILQEVRYALSNSFGFGSINSSLVIKKYGG